MCIDCQHRIILVPSLVRRLAVVLEAHYGDGTIARSHEPAETVDKGEPTPHR
jgi:hypothetical protein